MLLHVVPRCCTPSVAGRDCSQLAAAELAPRTGPGFDTGMKSLAVRVLGDFGVDGLEPHAIGSRKARLALHLLALAGGQAVPSGVLIDAIWGRRSACPARGPAGRARSAGCGRWSAGTGSATGTAATSCAATGWTRPSWPCSPARWNGARRPGNVMGAASAARVALSLVRGDGPRRAAGRVGPAPAGRAGAPGRPRPPGGGRRAAGCGRLDGRRRRRGARRWSGSPTTRRRCGCCSARTRWAAGWRPRWPRTPAPGSGWPRNSAPTRRRRRRRCTPPSCAATWPRPGPPPGRPRHGRGRAGRPGRRAGLPRRGRAAVPRRPRRGHRRRRGGGDREDHAAAGLGGPPRRGRGHRAQCPVRAARPRHAAGRAADRAGRAAAPARPRAGHRCARLRCGGARAAARHRARPRAAAGAGRQHARPGRAVRGAGPGAGPARRTGPAGR